MKNHNKNLICIVVAVEKENQVENKFRISSKIAGFGLPSQDRIYSVLKNKIVPDDNTTLITDGAKAYGLLAKQLSLNWKRLVTQTKGRKRVPKIEGIYNVQTVNAFHRKLKDFLRNTHGVSSKYLQGFLELFDFRVNYSELSSDDQELLILKTLLNCEFHLTNEELASRYCIPTYVGQIAAEWKKKFSRNEIRIYKEIKRGHPLDDIVNKYQVSRQQIRRLVNQIERLNMDAEILRQNTKKEPAPKREYTEKQWEIYTLYKTGKYTHKELAKQYGCTRQNIGKIIKKIDKTSSAYDRAERQSLSKLTLRSRRAAEKRKRTANNHKKIYDQFNVLCGGNSRISLTQAYSTIGKWNNMSKNTIRNIVFRYRKSDPNAVWRKKGTRIAIDVKHKISSPVMSENP